MTQQKLKSKLGQKLHSSFNKNEATSSRLFGHLDLEHHHSAVIPTMSISRLWGSLSKVFKLSERSMGVRSPGRIVDRTKE